MSFQICKFVFFMTLFRRYQIYLRHKIDNMISIQNSSFYPQHFEDETNLFVYQLHLKINVALKRKANYILSDVSTNFKYSCSMVCLSYRTNRQTKSSHFTEIYLGRWLII